MSAIWARRGATFHCWTSAFLVLWSLVDARRAHNFHSVFIVVADLKKLISLFPPTIHQTKKGVRVMFEKKTTSHLLIGLAALLTAGFAASGAVASQHGHHHKGCFVTTSPQAHARGVRHWVSPCPHRELKHMNPYHAPHHKMRYNPETGKHHRHD